MRRFHLNNVKLRNKLLLMYFLSVFLPIVLTNAVFYQVTTNHIKNQKIRDASAALEQAKNEFRGVIDEAVGLSYLFYTDAVLHEYLDRDYSSVIEYVEAYDSYLRSAFAKSNQAYQSVKWVQIYTDNPTVLPSGNIELITDEVRGCDWYEAFTRASAPYPVIVHAGNSFSLIQRLDRASDSSRLHLIKIDLNMDAIRHLFRDSPFEGKLYLVDPDGRVAYANDDGVDWQAGAAPFRSVSMLRSAISFHKPYANINYLDGWSLYGVMNEKTVLKEVRKSRSFVVVLACVNFLLPTVILASMARSLHVRLIRILKYMKKVKNQHFESIPGAESRDEIGQLTWEFNRMTLRIRDLINDVYLADIQRKDLELKQRQAQLHALHSQINPHFLFNALETIRMRSLLKGEAETAKVIQHMAKMFRKSLSWERDWVTVREELDLIGCFLEIQKYRFGDKLEYRLAVEDSAYERYIPKMTFLPFVENASMHGIETSPGKGVISITIGISGDHLVFRLADNGSGIPREKLDDMIRYLREGDLIGDKVGMKNVYCRLKLCYKDAFRFSIQSGEGAGTSIEIRLPAQMAGHGLPTDMLSKV